MDDEPLLPRRVTLLGEAMRPLWRKIETRLDEHVVPVTPAYGLDEVVSCHLNELHTLGYRLTDRINDLMSDVVANEHSTDGDVYRAVGRFEVFVEELLAGYRDVRALDAHGRDAEARDLLAGVYRHTLVEIRDWLEDLIETLADPMAAVRRRGLPTTGYVELPLILTLTAAPELADLSRWIEGNAGVFPSGAAARRESGLGFWGTVGAVILGWGIGEALFGDDD
ncbi:MAG: hypothetical protein LBE85_13275 [Candidatus Accumulibacter sp.]|jgi:hypothetical protein|nr:hypothetical protein [Accumulibacter sp.]